ncbi:unnamed protein product [Blepharisma stoltei]|uniref:Uncharacterized protein n=1 Tax=Blepharisma stoltei TaxID=1481888 RepID=A0AAU9J2Q7_9CILI|nr:unnamed protein product [Blepharisma stoltei]
MNRSIFVGDSGLMSPRHLKSPKASPKSQPKHRHSLSAGSNIPKLISLKNLNQERSILKNNSQSRDTSPEIIQSKLASVTEQWTQMKSGISAQPQAEKLRLNRNISRTHSAERFQNDHSQELLKMALKASSILQRENCCKSLENSSIKETQDTDCSMHQEEKYLAFLPVPCAIEAPRTTTNKAKPSLVMDNKNRKPPRLLKKSPENPAKSFENCYKMFSETYKKVNVS